jgi:hypothetical protein
LTFSSCIYDSGHVECAASELGKGIAFADHVSIVGARYLECPADEISPQTPQQDHQAPFIA